METMVALSEVKLKRPEKSDIAAEISDNKSFVKEKGCIYFDELECVIPHGSLNICRTCPLGYLYFFGFVVKNVFDKIIGKAADLLERTNQEQVIKLSYLDKDNIAGEAQ